MCYLVSHRAGKPERVHVVSRKPEWRYDPVGSCIYCGSDGAPDGLTDEHIVPYSLEGIWILPKSSCKRCAGITSSVEMFCARDFYGSFRLREQLRTRRPSKRPAQVEVMAGPYSNRRLLTVPEKGAIAQFPIIRLKPPGALRNPPVETDTWEGVELEIKADAPREPSHWRNLPSGSLSFAPVTFHVPTFARLCAKIGHSFAIAEFGSAGFDHWLPPYILGINPKLPYVVGSSHEAQRSDNVATALNWSVYETPSFNLLVINVHLFPHMGQPPVSVVAGSISPAQYTKVQSRLDQSLR